MSTVDVHAGLGPGLSDDEALEREIENARLAMVKADAAGDRDGVRECKETLYAFIARRSPEQRARMEAKLPKKWGAT